MCVNKVSTFQMVFVHQVSPVKLMLKEMLMEFVFVMMVSTCMEMFVQNAHLEVFGVQLPIVAFTSVVKIVPTPQNQTLVNVIQDLVNSTMSAHNVPLTISSRMVSV